MEELKKQNIRVPTPVARQMKAISKRTGRKLESIWLEAAQNFIHHTPRSQRIEYAKRIAEIKRSRGTDRSEVPF